MKKNTIFWLVFFGLIPALGFGQIFVNFDNLTAGTTYGPPGQTPGDIIFTENNITATVDSFQFMSGGSAFHQCSVDPAFTWFGYNNIFRFNNMNVIFDFSGLPFPSTHLTLSFADLGGFENIAVNGEPLFAGEWSDAPPMIATGVWMSVSAVDITGGRKGTLCLRGPVHQLEIGGQELWIDYLSVGDLIKKCVTFETPALGTQYGFGVNVPTELVLVEDDIPVVVHEFLWTTGGTFGTGRIDPAFSGFGFSQVCGTNNMNLMFYFTNLGFPATSVSLEFADLGGYENISVNGQPVFVGELTAAPSAIAPGVFMQVTVSPVTGGQRGRLALIGPVDSLLIGGQEFWMDNVCAWDSLGTDVLSPSGAVMASPRFLELEPNFPNPFNPSTLIRFSLPGQGEVILSLYDLLGQTIKTWEMGVLDAGSHTIRWDGRDTMDRPVPSGVYICRLQAGGEVRIRKMTLVR
jgi:hypothetical protein